MGPAKKRLEWDEYFMQIAFEASSRATCSIRPSGAVIVRDRKILSSGYTGGLRGLPHCDELGHPAGATSCDRVISGEINAIILAARNGINIAGGALYTTAAPDWYAFQHIANAGIVTVCHALPITDELVQRFAKTADVDLIHISPRDA